MAGEGDLLPVSALPVDGTFPTGTAQYEKRAIAQELPIWDPDICIDCGKCAIVCPHATIRMKVFEPSAVAAAPATFLSKDFRSKDIAGYRMTIQVAPDDCTGCGVCVDVCPAKSKTEVRHKAINMEPALDHRDPERPSWDFFLPFPSSTATCCRTTRSRARRRCNRCSSSPGPAPGAARRRTSSWPRSCSATGWSWPTPPGARRSTAATCRRPRGASNGEGRGPAWSNSLFEDNAEFGLGLRLGMEAQTALATSLLEQLSGAVAPQLIGSILTADQESEAGIRAQRDRVAALAMRCEPLAAPTAPTARRARHLLALAGSLTRQGVWIIGGDGWAYDIGFGGLDHVLSSGRNVNILVLDTEVYSNTGGQASKATSRGAVAKFASAGKSSGKKDLGAIARAYGNVYVAEIAIGANDLQSTKALAGGRRVAGTVARDRLLARASPTGSTCRRR